MQPAKPLRPQGAKLASNLTIVRPVILVLAEGKTDADRNNERGHLFEKFIALLLEAYGFEESVEPKLNVKSGGIELDVVTTHRMTKQRAVAECKAYSTNLPAKDLSAFYGKVHAERFDHPDLVGFFVAIPGLTADGVALHQKIAARDKAFHLLTADEVVGLLRTQGIVRDEPKDGLLRSDLAVILTPHGTYSAAKVLDQKTRLAAGVQVWGTGGIPDPVITLIAASEYASGIPVSSISQGVPAKPLVLAQTEPTIVEVVGSKSELEYQLPASPKFFVGRRDHVKGFEELLDAGIETGQILVLNGQSGWGKSSLSLQLKSIVHNRHGHAVVYDSRTAATPEFVWQALRKASIAAERAGIVTLPAAASYASLNSVLSTIRDAKWKTSANPLFVFFDQFENVFRDTRLTREFRNLALAIRDMQVPVVVGFAWKTDLVGLTETYPYQLRDDIRSCATVFIMEPLGPAEISTLLKRLEKSTGQKFQKDLKQRLREVSQGLPWLFKKLASHVDRELRGGTTQEDLVSESLNVKRLFETDLAELDVTERDAIKRIAKIAPRPASDVVEIVPAEVVQSLLDRRLIVRVGDLLDTYWDIFRDFLVSGEVVVAETYIMRQTPFAVGKLLKEAISAGGDLTVDEASTRLSVTEGGVFNLSRELRQTGVIAERPRRIHIHEDILRAADREVAIRERVATSLKRHKVVAMLKEMATNQDSPVTLATLADALPKAFPAIQATKKVWRQYARVFSNWLEYAGLAESANGNITIPPSRAPKIHLLSSVPGESRKVRGSGKFFPSSRPNHALPILQAVSKSKPMPPMKPSTLRKATTDLLVLGLMRLEPPEKYSLNGAPLDVKGQLNASNLLAALEAMGGAKEAIRAIRKKQTSTSEEIGKVLQAAYKATWNELTVRQTGTKFLAWARAAGLKSTPTRRKRRPSGAK